MLNKFVQFLKVPELRRRFLMVILLLVATRIIVLLPIPAVDIAQYKAGLAEEGAVNRALLGNIFGYLNLISGGALDKLSIGMLGVSPYITATIILQLLTMIFPKLKEYYYENGAVGRAKFQRLGRYLTVPLALVQGFAFLKYLAAQGGIITAMELPAMALNLLFIVAGSLIMIWIGEMISEQKLGDGISLIIVAGIVSGLPRSIITQILVMVGQYQSTGTLLGIGIDKVLILLALALVVVAGVVLVNEGERKIPVAYAKRVRGNRVFGGSTTYLPLRVNQAGVIPIIFAISILMLPQYLGLGLRSLDIGWAIKTADFIEATLANPLWNGLLYFVMVFAFTYFYTFIVFEPNEIAKNLQRNGGFIQGIRPGASTAEYLNSIIAKLTLFGALFLGVIAVLPSIVQAITKVANMTIGGTGLLIVVSVALETAKQIDSELKIREYEIA
ncbi:MAG TPA: preprotein translocase subunit SecY [Candidatus Colwellbacteria bacterium]|nr:preprotein translocase subunit SecY [Candidatus Colwellbacteria bacterium]